jgi:hypothetical protein
MFDPYYLTGLSSVWNRAKLRTRNLYLRYKYPVRITVAWPNGEVEVGPSSRNHNVSDSYYQTVTSSDPNDHYRPALEKNVGRQGVDWDWGNLFIYYHGTYRDQMEIMFKKKHEKMAIYYQLKWG